MKLIISGVIGIINYAHGYVIENILLLYLIAVSSLSSGTGQRSTLNTGIYAWKLPQYYYSYF